MLILSGFVLFAGSSRGALAANADRWINKEFGIDGAILQIQIPPGYRTFNMSLPELEYDKNSERRLLDAQYDYGFQKYTGLAQFEIIANLLRLVRPVDTKSWSIAELDEALRLVFGRPINAAGSPRPTLEQVVGQQWIYYDNSTAKTYGVVRETFATLVDGNTALLISGWYLEDIQKDFAWFQSRRELLRKVRDHVVVTP